MEMIGKVLGNRYEIIEKIGSGGMATVYKAKCKLLNRNVAVKILRDEFANDAEFIKRFQVEAQAAASLSHPNIVSIYDVGEENGLHYIVMELIEGKTLKEIITEKGRLPWKDAVKIAMQIASGLEQAHKNHIIHRDIKPHNIIMTKDGNAKVTDFGIAKAVSNSTINAFGSTVGSVHYFSPEHARGGYTDEKSDIYSLGVVLYEMLTGKLPFDAETPVSVALKHIQEVPIEPSELVRDIPIGVNNVVMKAMQKDVNNRYASASAMYNDLQKALKNPEIISTTINLEEKRDFPTQKVPIIGGMREEYVDDNNYKNKKYGEEEMSARKGKKTKKQAIIGLITFIVLAIGLFFGAFWVALKVAPMIFGEKAINVPSIVGMHKDEAEKTLEAKGLKMEVQASVTNNEYPKDYVIYQQYAEGYELKSGATVGVRISKGAETFLVPDVTLMSVEAAKLEIEKYKLVYKEETEPSNTVPKGSIVRQSPVVNTEVVAGSTVTVYISAGPIEGMIETPSVVGRTEAEARAILVAANLIPKVEYVKKDSQNDGEVISQSPEKDEYVSELTEVVIIVNQLSENSTGTEAEPNDKEDENNKSDENKPVTPTTKKTVNIDLSNKGSRSTFVVKVELQSSTLGTKILHEEVHQRKDGKISIALPEGSEGSMLKVYIDDTLDSEMVIK